MSYFEDLKVWQKAKDMAVRAHRITRTKGFEKNPELAQSMRQAAADVACLIADGSVRGAEKSSMTSYFNAKGLVAQFDTITEMACALGCLDENPRNALRQESETVAKMLSGLIKAQRDPERKGNGAEQGEASY